MPPGGMNMAGDEDLTRCPNCGRTLRVRTINLPGRTSKVETGCWYCGTEEIIELKGQKAPVDLPAGMGAVF